MKNQRSLYSHHQSSTEFYLPQFYSQTNINVNTNKDESVSNYQRACQNPFQIKDLTQQDLTKLGKFQYFQSQKQDLKEQKKTQERSLKKQQEKKDNNILKSNTKQKSNLYQKTKYPQTTFIKYSSIFQTIVGRQNIFPMFIDTNQQHLFICAKDCFVITDKRNLIIGSFDIISEQQKINKQQNQQQNQWLKVMFPDSQMPTTMKAGKRFLYFGYSNGKIAQYDLAKLSFSTSCEQFVAPIMQIQILYQQSSEHFEVNLIAMDSASNLKELKFSHKSLMDRIIKVSIDTFDLKIYRKIKKRQKIKKLFKGFLSSKQKDKQNPKPNQGNDQYSIPYHYVKFAIPPKEFQKQGQTTIAYFYPYSHIEEQQKKEEVKDLQNLNSKSMTQTPQGNQNQQKTSQKLLKQEEIKVTKSSIRYKLSCITYEHSSKIIISQQNLLSQIKDMGMLTFGYGGFQCGNSTHILLLVSVGKQIYYFRSVDVEGIYQWHLVSEIQMEMHKDQQKNINSSNINSLSMPILQHNISHNSLIYGEFISNNLVLYLSKDSVSIGNVNEPLKYIHEFNLNKFEYISFFNSESEFKFKFDQKLNQKGLLRSWIDKESHYKLANAKIENESIISDENNIKISLKFLQEEKTQSGYYTVLQGKRLIIGKILSWKQFLNKFIENDQWIQGMQYALEVFKGRMKKLTSINQKVQIRKQNMQKYFQKITLTFLSLNLKKRYSEIQIQKDKFLNNQNTQSSEQAKKQILIKQQQKNSQNQKINSEEEDKLSVSPTTVQKIQKQTQINLQQIKQIISQTVTQKIEETNKKENIFDKKMYQIIKIVIKFMIQTQNQHCLFTTIYQAIKNQQLQIYFYQCLWEHINQQMITNQFCLQSIQKKNSLNKKKNYQQPTIKFMTEQILLQTVNHYKNKKQSKYQLSLQLQTIGKSKALKHLYEKILNRLIMNFDLTVMQRALLLSLTLNQGLYQALIYICTQDKDYVTPIVKLGGLRMQKYYSMKNQNQQKFIKQSQQLTNVIFFYLRQCLKGRMTQFGNTSQFLFMLQQLLSFLFIPSSLEMLGQIQPFRVMQIIDILFQPKILQVIMQNQGLKIKNRIVYQKTNQSSNKNTQESFHSYHQRNVIKVDERIFEQNTIQEYQVYQNILTTLIYVFTNLGKSKSSLNLEKQSGLQVKKGSQISERQYNNIIKLNNSSQMCFCHTAYEYELWKFVTYTMLKNQLPFKIKYKLICVKFFIRHPYLFLGLFHKNSKQQQQQQKQKISFQSIIQEKLQEKQEQINSLFMRLMDSLIRSLDQQDQRIQQIQLKIKQQKQRLQSQKLRLKQKSQNKQLQQTIDKNINKKEQQQIDQGQKQQKKDHQKQTIEENILSLSSQLNNIQIYQFKKVIKDLISQIQQQNNQQSISFKPYLMESLCYLYHQLLQPEKVLITYLQMKSRKQRQKVFAYLKHNLSSLFEKQGNYKKIRKFIEKKSDSLKKQSKQQSSLALLNKQIIKNIESLLFLNQEESLELLIKVAKIGINDPSQIIMKLAGYPQLQLQFIQKILQFLENIQNSTHHKDSMKQHGNTNKNALSLRLKELHSLLVCHLQIVVQNKIELLQFYIQKMNYPLEEAYKVCEQRKNKKGMASILVKSGRISQGINMLNQIFLDSCDKIFKKLAKKSVSKSKTKDKNQSQIQLQNYVLILDSDQQKQKDELMSVLSSILINCAKQYKNDAERGQQIWSLTADRIFKRLRVKNMQDHNIPLPIKKILHEIVDKTMNQMFLSVSPHFYVNKFVNLNLSQQGNQPTSNTFGLPNSIILQGYNLAWMKLNFQQRVQQLAMQQAQKVEMITYKQIIKQNGKGWLCGQFCGGTQQQYINHILNKKKDSLSLQNQNTQNIQLNLVENFQAANIKQILQKQFGCHRSLINQSKRFKGQYLTFSKCHHTYHLQCSTLNKCQNCKDQLSQRIQKQSVKIKKKIEMHLFHNNNLASFSPQKNENIINQFVSMNNSLNSGNKNINNQDIDQLDITIPLRIKSENHKKAVLNKQNSLNNNIVFNESYFQRLKTFDEKFNESGWKCLKEWEYSQTLNGFYNKNNK